MRISFTKGTREDRIAIRRGDGSGSEFGFPKKGPTPHDVYHYFAERELGLKRGFWGLVASGLDPEKVGALAAAGGHASAKRAAEPDPGIVELVQSERLVECFEAESWSKAADNAAVRAMANAGWRASLVPPLALRDDEIERIRDGIAAFAADWAGRSAGETVHCEWESNHG